MKRENRNTHKSPANNALTLVRSEKASSGKTGDFGWSASLNVVRRPATVALRRNSTSCNWLLVISLPYYLTLNCISVKMND